MGEQPYVDRYIDFMNETFRPERAAVYVSMSHPSRPERIPQAGERISGRGESKPSWERKGEQPHAD